MNREEYEKNPKKCLTCDTIIDFEKRRNKYCCRKCFPGSFSKRKNPIIWSCAYCEKEFIDTSHVTRKFCSRECTISYQRLSRRLSYENGNISDRTCIKNYLISDYGYKCFVCDITDWLGKELILELDHVDGNASNNSPSNLRLLCPNCHSQTDTWKSRNKGSGRKSLGISLA